MAIINSYKQKIPTYPIKDKLAFFLCLNDGIFVGNLATFV